MNLDNERPDNVRAAGVGLLSGAAYLGAMWLDNRISSHKFDDLKLVGQMVTTESPAWQVQGVGGHFGFSVVMGLLYARLFYPRFPGPDWLKGLVFINIENALLYPGALVIDRKHAGITKGEIPPLLNWKTWWGQVVRHLAFGLTLGLLYRPRR